MAETACGLGESRQGAANSTRTPLVGGFAPKVLPLMVN